jgi:hypothetical protein
MDRFVRIGEDYLAQAASWFFAFINFLGESWWLWLLLGFLPVALIITLRRVAGMLDEEEIWELSLVRLAANALLNLFFYSFLAGLGLLVVGYYGGSLLYSQHGLDIWWRHITDMSSWFFAGIGAGITAGTYGHFLVGGKLEPWFSSYLHEKTKKADSGDRLSDVRDLQVERSIRPIGRDELNALLRSDRGIYFGKDQNGNNIFVRAKKIKSTHVLTMGASGLGKGLQLQILLAQAILAHEAVYFFDPKNDEWLASVLYQVNKESGSAFLHINLKSPTPQINPLYGITADELFELLVTIFDLIRKGDIADHHRNNDREAAWDLSRIADKEIVSFSSLYHKASDVLTEQQMEECRGFLTQLKELSRVQAFNTLEDPGLGQILETGGVVHVVGVMRGETLIAAQKALALRVIQLIENRGERQNKHAWLLLDEFRFIASDQTVKALATIRDKKATMLLSVQTRDDVLSIPGVDGQEARTVVEVNCRLKWIYQVDDRESAKWAAGLTGSILAGKERVEVQRNEIGSEVSAGDRHIDQIERFLVDENQMQNLPEGCALMIGDGQAKLVYTSPIITEKHSFSLSAQKAYTPVSEDSLLRPNDNNLEITSAMIQEEDPLL